LFYSAFINIAPNEKITDKLESIWKEAVVHPLLGNGLVNKFPQKKMRETLGRLLLGTGAVNTYP
jgi:hypothetical protein